MRTGSSSRGVLDESGSRTMRRSSLGQFLRHVATQQEKQQHSSSIRRSGQAVDGLRLSRRFMPYPQPNALGPALMEAQMWLLGKLLSVVPLATQIKVCTGLAGARSLGLIQVMLFRTGWLSGSRAEGHTAVQVGA